MKKMTKMAVLLGVLAVVPLMAACRSPDEPPETPEQEYAITITPSPNGRVSGKKTAEAGELVTLSIVPDRGYNLASILVTGSSSPQGGAIPLGGRDSAKTFTMPSEDVVVSAVFAPTGPVSYAIIINEMEGGGFDVSPADRQQENGTVTLIARPDSGYKYRPGSLKVSGRNSGRALTITVADDCDEEWFFTMPAEDVAVDADFIDEDIELYDIIIDEIDNGIILCGQTFAVAGDTVILSLIVDDPDDYRYRNGSLQVAGESGWDYKTSLTSQIETTLLSEGGAEGELQWAFIMPEESVTVTAIIEFIPYFNVQVAVGLENGSLTISGVETDGDYEGKAREGAVITISAYPDAGYKLAEEGLWAIPENTVDFVMLDGAWVFCMADTDLEIGAAFAELGLLEIYKGGARKGITVGGIVDDNINKYFANSIDMESEEAGHNGNLRAIKITQATSSGGGTAQQSFGLFSDTEVDLETVVALSFWAKANKGLNIRYVGFGDSDPGKRVVYTGENFNQQIGISSEWKRYIVPVPAPGRKLKAARVFMFNASISAGNYVCIDDIEFIQSGVTLTGITIANTNDELYYGASSTEKILRGVPVKLNYICDDGVTVTLQGASSNHTLKHNLAPWLAPFAAVSGNVIFSDGIIIPKESRSAFTLILSMAGISSNPMLAALLEGFMLDDFEYMADASTKTIPGTPEEARAYLWHTSSSGSTVIVRDYFNAENKEIHSGLSAGNWRSIATANKPRGGRNFEAKDAGAYNTLSFWIKVTTGGNVNIQKNTVFTFELRNGGTLISKTNGTFFAQPFTYNPDAADGWQNIIMPLSAFADSGLDTSAITGYAIGVVDNKGVALRVMLDDVAIVGSW
jgi:hypothetical protein